jgi:hypothetical protein
MAMAGCIAWIQGDICHPFGYAKGNTPYVIANPVGEKHSFTMSSNLSAVGTKHPPSH